MSGKIHRIFVGETVAKRTIERRMRYEININKSDLKKIGCENER
jgi:hypothetical protein